MTAGILRKKVHEETTGDDVANFISRANRLNLFAICIGQAVALYKIDVESGVLELLQRIEVPGLDP